MADGGIGSVGVTVTPDARNFWREFEAQTRSGAAEAGRSAGRDWRAGFDSATRDVRVNVRARVDTNGARDELRRFQAEQTRSMASGNQSSVSLLGVLASLAPALVPLAGAAATAGAALGVMGVTGLVAVKGIEAEIKKGTATGLQYAAGVAQIKAEYAGLEHQLAQATLPAFRGIQAQLTQFGPQLTNDLKQIAPQVGDVAQHLLGGLIGGLRTFIPALQPAFAEVDALAARFESWATGPGGAKFATSLANDFQQVVPVLGQVVELASHLVAASNGPGLAIVKVLGDLSQVLNEIPLPVLSALVAGFVGLKVASTVAALMDKLALSIRGVAVAEGEGAVASAGFRGGLATGVGILGKVVAGVLVADLAFKTLANSTSGAATSSSKILAGLHQASLAFSELFSGHPGQALSDAFGSGQLKAERYRSYVVGLRSDLAALSAPAKASGFALSKLFNAASVQQYRKVLQEQRTVLATPSDATKGTIAGHGSVAGQAGPSVGDQLRIGYAREYRTELQRLADAQTNFNTAASKSTSISGLSNAYGQQATAIDKTVSAQQRLISSGDKIGGAGGTYHGITIGVRGFNAALEASGGNVAKAVGYIHAQIDASLKGASASKTLAQESQRLGDAVGYAAAKYKLTSDQVDLYTQVLGIDATQVASGAISQRQFADAIGTVATAIANGSTSMQDYVAAIQQFNQTGDTAASRGALIGATLKAANGPLLAYANTMVSAATANQQLVTDFQNTSRSVLNLKNGTIDFHNAGAAPLLNDLSNLQTAAVNSAAATYQYETSQHKAGAAADAFKVYVNDTKGALEREFQQMGLTKGQADRLATSYFGIKNSGDLQKQIGLIGGDKVQQTLSAILADLDLLAGKRVDTYVYTHYSNVGAGSGHAAGQRTAVAAAIGGPIRGPGTSTSDSIPAFLSNGEFVINAAQTAKHRALLEAINGGVQGFASGGEPGGFTGVKYGGSGSGSGSGSSGSGSRSGSTAKPKATSASSSALASNIAQVRSAIGSLSAALSQGASSIGSASAQLIAAARAAHRLTASQTRVLEGDRHRLDRAASQYDRVAARLGTAPTAPTAYDRLATAQSNFSSARSSTKDAIIGTFNAATAGQTSSLFADKAPPPVTASSILAELTTDANNATKFAAALKSLAKAGLPKTLLMQLAQAGPSALPQALALQAATPAQLAGIKSEFTVLGSAGDAAGNTVASDLFGAGVAAAKGLVSGLKSQEKTLRAQIQNYAHILTQQVKDDLKIHSPSQVFHELGAHTGEGFRLGIESKFDAIARAGGGLAKAATPNVASLHRLGAAGAGGTVVSHTWNMPPMQDPVAMATATTRRLSMLDIA